MLVWRESRAPLFLLMGMTCEADIEEDWERLPRIASRSMRLKTGHDVYQADSFPACPSVSGTCANPTAINKTREGPYSSYRVGVGSENIDHTP